MKCLTSIFNSEINVFAEEDIKDKQERDAYFTDQCEIYFNLLKSKEQIMYVQYREMEDSILGLEKRFLNVLHHWRFETAAFQHNKHTALRLVMRPNPLAPTGSQSFWILEITQCPHTDVFPVKPKILVSTPPLAIKVLKNCSHSLPENLLTAGTFG